MDRPTPTRASTSRGLAGRHRPGRLGDTAGAIDLFPPPLDLDVRPADGPWVDPDLLGLVEDGVDRHTDPPDALLADLAAAEGDPVADWTTLHGSDDPAVRALALRWRTWAAVPVGRPD